MVECSFTNKVFVGSNPVAVTYKCEQEQTYFSFILEDIFPFQSMA